MEPAELRREAFHIKEVVQSGLFSIKFAGQVCELADHILSTVREDDGGAVTEEWLRSLPHTQGKYPDDIIIGPVVRMIVRNAQSPSNGRWDWCVRSYPIPEEHKPRSRGQLRRLLEGLGVGQ